MKRESDGASSTTAGVATIARLAAIGASALSSLVAARAMTAEGRGVSALFVQSGYFIGLLLTAGSERGLASGVVAIRRPGPKWATTAYALLGAPMVLYVFGAGTWIVGSACTLAMAAAVFLRRAVQALLVLHRRRSAIARFEGLQVLCVLASLLVAYSSGMTSPVSWTLVLSLSFAFPSVIYGIAILRSLGPTKLEESGAAGFSSALFVGDVAVASAQKLDRVVLGLTGQMEELGRYSLAASLSELTVLPATLARAVRSKSEATHRAIPEAVSFAIVTCGAIALIAFGNTIVGTLAGGDYKISRVDWIAIGMASTAAAAHQLTSGYFIRDRRLSQLMRSELLIGLVSAGTYLVLIPRHGLIGGALGTFAGYFSGTVYLALATLESSSSSGRERLSRARQIGRK